jgi:hypothetical protein
MYEKVVNTQGGKRGRKQGSDLSFQGIDPWSSVGGGNGGVLETTIPSYRSRSKGNLLVHMALESEVKVK